MTEARRKFTKEFKQEAIKLAEQLGSVREAAKSLGVREANLHRWKKQLSQDGVWAFPGNGKLKPEDQKIHDLEKELKRVKMERDILKKTIAYFAETSK